MNARARRAWMCKVAVVIGTSRWEVDRWPLRPSARASSRRASRTSVAARSAAARTSPCSRFGVPAVRTAAMAPSRQAATAMSATVRPRASKSPSVLVVAAYSRAPAARRRRRRWSRRPRSRVPVRAAHPAPPAPHRVPARGCRRCGRTVEWRRPTATVPVWYPPTCACCRPARRAPARCRGASASWRRSASSHACTRRLQLRAVRLREGDQRRQVGNPSRAWQPSRDRWASARCRWASPVRAPGRRAHCSSSARAADSARRARSASSRARAMPIPPAPAPLPCALGLDARDRVHGVTLRPPAASRSATASAVRQYARATSNSTCRAVVPESERARCDAAELAPRSARRRP